MKKVINIVEYIGRYTELKQIPGGEFVGLCPLHHEKTPSFFINEEKQQFCCMGCNVGGDILTFIQAYYHVPFEEAVEILSYETGKSPNVSKHILEEIKKFKKKDEPFVQRIYLMDDCMNEYPESHHINEWMAEGISEEVLTRYNVRYNKEKTKIMFPIWDIYGKIVAIKYRNLVDLPKYKHVNKVGVKDYLYNMNFAINSIIEEDECIIFESEKSVLKAETWNIHNTVAVGSHGLKDEIPSLIKLQFTNLVLAYDEDIKPKEIRKQVERLKHYKNIYVIPMDNFSAKEAPVDQGFTAWREAYENKKRVIY